ncbi:hypothetical protein VTK56DRAFT_10180 [Thermocarpiscus australiensis]
MEQSHMPVGQCLPQTQPGQALEEAPAAAIQDPSTAQASPDYQGHQHTLSGDFTGHRNATPSLQLPPLALSFGDEPTELAPIQPPHERSAISSQTLPPLSAVTGTQPQRHAPIPEPPEPSYAAPYSRPTNHWPSLNPFTTYYTPSYLEPVESAPTRSVDPQKSPGLRASSVSLDDPDVRIAAEALGHLRTDFVSSTRNQSTQSTSVASTPRECKTGTSSPQTSNSNQAEPEPLLSLITTSHPLLATTIEGAASAYNTGKNYSPHLKTGAEYVESYLNPVAKAVGSVGRKTGVEGGVRWIFGIRNKKKQSSSDLETAERGNNKRRKAESVDEAVQAAGGPGSDAGANAADRRTSVTTVDTLPPYDDHRAPAYTETADGSAGLAAQPWGQRLVVTTSGLGVAMKQESLRSLKYCLKVLRDMNGYISDVLVKLKSAIDEYDLATQKDGQDETMADAHTSSSHTAPDRGRLIQRMSELRGDIFRVIHQTVQTLSKYAGGALPENARNLVHRQLMSLPGLYQFHYVRESAESQRNDASPEWRARHSAHLALLFAKEALQMMTQVGDVLNRTLVSAEEWCETLYKQRNEQAEPATAEAELATVPAGAAFDTEDTKMSG